MSVQDDLAAYAADPNQAAGDLAKIVLAALVEHDQAISAVTASTDALAAQVATIAPVVSPPILG